MVRRVTPSVRATRATFQAFSSSVRCEQGAVVHARPHRRLGRGDGLGQRHQEGTHAIGLELPGVVEDERAHQLRAFHQREQSMLTRHHSAARTEGALVSVPDLLHGREPREVERGDGLHDAFAALEGHHHAAGGHMALAEVAKEGVGGCRGIRSDQ